MSSIKERTEIARESKRDIPSILNEIETLSTISNETALSCFYVVFDKKDNKPFVGISVRFAELIASCWGNIHAGAKIINSNGMKSVIQGFVHDFEKNAIFTVEVQRSTGGLSQEKQIQVTNAASSIAFRNAVFKAIPAAITHSIVKNIRKHIIENIEGGSVLKEVLDYFHSKEIKNSDLTDLLGCEIENIDSDKLFLLIGLRTAIEEGDTTIAEVFKKENSEKPLRSSKFNFETKELTEDEIIQVQKVNNKIGEAIETTKPKVVEEITIEDSENDTDLKKDISFFFQKKNIEDDWWRKEQKEIKPQVKKRGRGRPKKQD